MAMPPATSVDRVGGTAGAAVAAGDAAGAVGNAGRETAGRHSFSRTCGGGNARRSRAGTRRRARIRRARIRRARIGCTRFAGPFLTGPASGPRPGQAPRRAKAPEPARASGVARAAGERRRCGRAPPRRTVRAAAFSVAVPVAVVAPDVGNGRARGSLRRDGSANGEGRVRRAGACCQRDERRAQLLHHLILEREELGGLAVGLDAGFDGARSGVHQPRRDPQPVADSLVGARHQPRGAEPADDHRAEALEVGRDRLRDAGADPVVDGRGREVDEGGHGDRDRARGRCLRRCCGSAPVLGGDRRRGNEGARHDGGEGGGWETHANEPAHGKPVRAPAQRLIIPHAPPGPSQAGLATAERQPIQSRPDGSRNSTRRNRGVARRPRGRSARRRTRARAHHGEGTPAGIPRPKPRGTAQNDRARADADRHRVGRGDRGGGRARLHEPRRPGAGVDPATGTIQQGTVVPDQYGDRAGDGAVQRAGGVHPPQHVRRRPEPGPPDGRTPCLGT